MRLVPARSGSARLRGGAELRVQGLDALVERDHWRRMSAISSWIRAARTRSSPPNDSARATAVLGSLHARALPPAAVKIGPAPAARSPGHGAHRPDRASIEMPFQIRNAQVIHDASHGTALLPGIQGKPISTSGVSDPAESTSRKPYGKGSTTSPGRLPHGCSRGAGLLPVDRRCAGRSAPASASVP